MQLVAGVTGNKLHVWTGLYTVMDAENSVVCRSGKVAKKWKNSIQNLKCAPISIKMSKRWPNSTFTRRIGTFIKVRFYYLRSCQTLDWHYKLVPQRTMRPSTARSRLAVKHADLPSPIPVTLSLVTRINTSDIPSSLRQEAELAWVHSKLAMLYVSVSRHITVFSCQYA